MYHTAVLVLGVCLLGGCPAPVEPVVLDVGQIEAKVDYSALETVLKAITDKDGMILPDELDDVSERFDEQLKLLAVTGPTASRELFPTPEHRLAYWCNARAAWALKLAALGKLTEKLGTSELEGREFPLDGRTMTLREIDGILVELGGWETHVTAPGVLMQRAPLPKRPFSSEDVRDRIKDRLGKFIDDARFVIDISRKRILVPPVLWGYRDRILQMHYRDYGAEGATLTTALLGYVTGSGERRLQDAIGYVCVEASPTRKLAVVKED